MKRLTVLFLVLVLCLGGCSTERNREESITLPSQTTEESITLPSQTTEEPTRESPDEENSEKESTAETTAAVMPEAFGEALENLGSALEVLLFSNKDQLEENSNYLENERNRLIFAWELARFDPEVEKIRPWKEDYEYGVSEDTFLQYYECLFGQLPEAEIPATTYTMLGQICREDGYISSFHVGMGRQTEPLWLDQVHLTQEGEQVTLTAVMILPTAYEEAIPCGSVTITMTWQDQGYRLDSLVISDLTPKFKTDFAYDAYRESPYAEQSLAELLPLLWSEEQMPEELKFAVQYKLQPYAESFYKLTGYLDHEDAEVFDRDRDYMETFGDRLHFLWAMALREPGVQCDLGISQETGEIYGATGGLVVPVESLSKCSREWFGEDLDMAALEAFTNSENDCGFYCVKDGMLYGSYITGWGGPSPCIKGGYGWIDSSNGGKPILSCMYLAPNMESTAWNYEGFCGDEENYPRALVTFRMDFIFEETEAGYRLTSMYLREANP